MAAPGVAPSGSRMSANNHAPSAHSAADAIPTRHAGQVDRELVGPEAAVDISG
jgi:hypothetical protein